MKESALEATDIDGRLAAQRAERLKALEERATADRRQPGDLGRTVVLILLLATAGMASAGPGGANTGIWVLMLAMCLLADWQERRRKASDEALLELIRELRKERGQSD
jgi:hypothetical protein